MRWRSGYTHRMPLFVFVLAALVCSPAFAVEVHAPPSTSRMSALDRENDVVIPPPPPPPSPVIEALPLALGVYGVTAVAGMGVVSLGVTSVHDQATATAIVTSAIAVTSLAPVVAVGVLSHDVPWPVWPAMVVSTAPGIVSGGVIGAIAGQLLAGAMDHESDCIGCTTEEAVAMIGTPLVAAGLGGAVGLTTTMFIASAFVPAPDEAL
jgi:hypothetical protein